MAIAPRGGRQHAKGGGHRVAPTLDSQLHDVAGIEVTRVGGETGTGRMFDALIDGQDGHIAAAGQTAVVEQLGQVAQHLRRAVRFHEHPVDEVGPRKDQILLGNPFGRVTEQLLSLAAQ